MHDITEIDSSELIDYGGGIKPSTKYTPEF